LNLVEALVGHTAILDGELVARPDAKVDFYSLAPRMLHTVWIARWAANEVPVTFVAFDVLHLHCQHLTGLPLVERKRMLDGLSLVGPAWAINGWNVGDGDSLFGV
jgi:bifunctional non-homologous end joining protein LigD